MQLYKAILLKFPQGYAAVVFFFKMSDVIFISKMVDMLVGDNESFFQLDLYHIHIYQLTFIQVLSKHYVILHLFVYCLFFALQLTRCLTRYFSAVSTGSLHTITGYNDNTMHLILQAHNMCYIGFLHNGAVGFQGPKSLQSCDGNYICLI